MKKALKPVIDPKAKGMDDMMYNMPKKSPMKGKKMTTKQVQMRKRTALSNAANKMFGFGRK